MEETEIKRLRAFGAYRAARAGDGSELGSDVSSRLVSFLTHCGPRGRMGDADGFALGYVPRINA